LAIDDIARLPAKERLHNEELRNVYTSSNTTGVIKWRRMRWARHVAFMGQMRNTMIVPKEMSTLILQSNEDVYRKANDVSKV